MMKRFALLIALCMIIPAAVQAQQRGPRAPQSEKYLADSLYFAARSAMGRDENKEALRLFQQIRSRYPNADAAANASYYEAFLLYREENLRSLRAAHALLTDRNYLRNDSDYMIEGRRSIETQALLIRVCGALAEKGDKRCSDDLIRTARELRCGDDPETSLRVNALSAVQRMDPKNATAILKKILSKRDQCPNVKRQAMYIALRQQSPDLIGTMYDIAVKEPDKEIRWHAISYLIKNPTEETAEKLIKLARQEKDLQMRIRIVQELRNPTGDVAEKLIELARQEKDPQLRAAIIQELSRSDNPDVIKALVKLLKK